MKRVAVFTGKRGGFGAMFGIMDLINNDPEMSLQVIVSDMHLSQKFGATVSEVEKRYKISAKVDLGDYEDSLIARTSALGRCITELAKALEKLKPHILLLLGDRGETLAAAFCAVEMGICVAHIQAGDISGGVDDIHRHAITKLSHIHFSQNNSQKLRVLKLGEISDNVYNTGAPYIDNIRSSNLPDFFEVLSKLKIRNPKNDHFIILHHPDTYNLNESAIQIEAILETFKEVKGNKIVVYPCSDPGYKPIVNEIKKYSNTEDYYIFKSIEALDFLSILSNVKAIIGNSSCGIIEAPYLKIPFILVGERQSGREYGSNVVSITNDYHNQILGALNKINEDEFIERINNNHEIFGDGYSSERIYKVLKNTIIDKKFFRKRITF